MAGRSLIGLGAMLCSALSMLASATAEPLPAAPWNSVHPAGWPLTLQLPASGELLLAGVDGVTAYELGGRDMQWYDPVYANDPSGRFYLVSAACVEPTAEQLTPGGALVDWSVWAAGYRAHLEDALEGEVLAEGRVKTAAAEWHTWRVRQPDGGAPDAQNELLLAVAAVDGRLVEVWCFYAKPWNEERSPQMLERMLGKKQ